MTGAALCAGRIRDAHDKIPLGWSRLALRFFPAGRYFSFFGPRQRSLLAALSLHPRIGHSAALHILLIMEALPACMPLASAVPRRKSFQSAGSAPEIELWRYCHGVCLAYPGLPWARRAAGWASWTSWTSRTQMQRPAPWVVVLYHYARVAHGLHARETPVPGATETCSLQAGRYRRCIMLYLSTPYGV